MLRSAIDELFAGGREHAEATPSKAEPTFARAYLAAMRAHERRSALLHWADGQWQETPDWRLDRFVIRLGLHWQERIGIKPGDRIAIVAPVCREWAFAELACLVQGIVPVAVDPALPEEVLAAALASFSPVVALAGDEVVLARLQSIRASLPSLRSLIAFETPEAADSLMLSEVIDLGGTLDTPERAQAFRARARAVLPGSEALGWFEDARRSAACSFLAHQDVAARLERLWGADPPRPGDVTYLGYGAVSQGARVALLAAIADGLSTLAFGTERNEASEIAKLSPHRIVASAKALRAGLPENGGSAIPPRRKARSWLGGLARRRQPQQASPAQSALGGRARWVHPVIEVPGEAAGLARLGELVTVDMQSEA